MKKLKPISMLITSFAVIVACIVPSFSAVKAESLTSGTVGNYGSYYAETFRSNNNTSVMNNYVIDLGLIQYNMNVANCSCFHFRYDFFATLTGDITITVVSNNSYKLNDCSFSVEGGYFINIPDKTTSSTSKTFTIGLYNTKYIDFYLYHNGNSVQNFVFLITTTFSFTTNMTTGTSDISILNHIDAMANNMYDYMVDDMTTTYQNMLGKLTDIGDYLEIISTDYNLNKYYPTENLQGYMWAKSYTMFPYYTYNLDIPFCYVPRSTSASYDINHRIFLEKGETKVFYYLTDQFIANANIFISTSDGSAISQLTNQFQYSKVLYNSNNYVVYLNRCVITRDSELSATQFSLGFNVNNLHICPLYIGNYNNVPQWITQLTGEEIKNTYTSLLDRILQAIRSLGGENLYDTSTYDDAVDDAGDFMDNVVNTLPSVGDVQSDINALPSFDPADSNFKLDDMAGFTNYVYVQMTNIFPFLKTFVVLGLIVILMKVFL